MKKKSCILLIILLLLILVVNNFSYADKVIEEKDFNKFVNSSTASSVKLIDMSGRIVGAISTIGTVVSVVALVIIGMKYMLGSIDEKAEYKKVLLPYFIGAILVLSITTIPNIIFNAVQTINN